MKQDGEGWTPTGFGLILFGKQPRTALPQAGLLGTIRLDDGREELRDFDGPQVLVPDQVLDWLRNKLANPIERSAAQRSEVNLGLFELIRESVVNALVHRDYSIEGAKNQLVVTPDTIAVRSPGLPVEPITLAQLQSFSAPMLSRNPILHYVFGRMELAEERGLGLKSMRRRAEEGGLPLPRYSWEPPYLTLTLYRNPDAAIRGLGRHALERLSADELAAWRLAAGRESVTSPVLMKEMGFDERKAQRVLKSLINAGLLRRDGRGRATKYTAVRE